MAGRITVAGLVLIGLAVADPGAHMASEFARIRLEAAAVLPSSDGPAVMGRIDRGEAAIKAGRLFLALYELQPAYESVGGHRLARTEKEFQSHADFERKWKEMGKPAPPPASRADLAFVEALAQSAESRAPATYMASLPYAADAQMMAGLYYLGESHAMVKFAAFCRSLEFPVPARRLSLSSIEPYLARHEAAVVKAYDASPEAARPRYPGVHVAIKIARTLDEQGRHEGALLQYLVSRVRFGVIRTLDAEPPTVGAVKDRISGFEIPTDTDHSIAQFLLQLAAATNEGTDPGPRGAAVILDDVLPAYFAAVKRP